MKVTIRMPETVAVLVDDDGEPRLWGEGDEYNLSVFGDYWSAYRDAGSKTLKIKEISQQELEELLRGRWSGVTHLVYHPHVSGYQLSKDSVLETA